MSDTPMRLARRGFCGVAMAALLGGRAEAREAPRQPPRPAAPRPAPAQRQAGPRSPTNPGAGRPGARGYIGTPTDGQGI